MPIRSCPPKAPGLSQNFVLASTLTNLTDSIQKNPTKPGSLHDFAHQSELTIVEFKQIMNLHKYLEANYF
jgi:hypothetical protein